MSRARIDSNSNHPTEKEEPTMKTTKKNTGIKVTAGVKAGGFDRPNHNRAGLKIRGGLKAGTMIQLANHNCRLLPIA